MKTSDFDYSLPLERIAQVPIEPRHDSRLMVLDRRSEKITHVVFRDIGDFLYAGDLLVLNRTRVIPARIFGTKPTGGRVELLLIKKKDPTHWEVLVGGKRVQPGKKIQLENEETYGVIIEELSGSRRVVEFDKPIEPYLISHGQMPLPPYIHTPLKNPERYQTVYADVEGSAAAPTAGLHFTHELLEKLEKKGIGIANVTLHVGLDTFAPVTEDDATSHVIHSEWCSLDDLCAAKINTARKNKGRIIAVGTTSARTLESAAQHSFSTEGIAQFEGQTSLFILPGYHFQLIDGLVTNFHLPRSTLLMMVSAFAGREFILHAYREAIAMDYRFYSFGDAMLIL